MSFDTLIEKIKEKNNPTVVGLDTKPEYIPDFILNKHIAENGETFKAAAEACFEFNKTLIDALYKLIPAVKPQSAFYEMLGPDGVKAFKMTVDYAKEKGMYVIADVKRGDIGSTAEAYAQAYLGSVTIGKSELRPFACDCLTVNAYLGSDGLKPFLNEAVRYGGTFFALVKTSNKSSGELQDLYVGDKTVYEQVASLIESLSSGTVGKYGYGKIGAVAGATYPEELLALRRRFKNTFFLVPGYGAQGGGAKDAAAAFDESGNGAIVNSSRAIICAWQKNGGDGHDFAACALGEAEKMRDELRRVIPVTP